MNDGQKVRVHAGDWNHILKDGKPLVIVTSWSMQLGGGIKKLNSVTGYKYSVSKQHVG
jgi:hypothetical protein